MKIWCNWKSMMLKTILTVMSIKLIDNNLLTFRRQPQISKVILTSKLKGSWFQRRGLKHRLMSSSRLSRNLESTVSLAINFSKWILRDMSNYLLRILARQVISFNRTIKMAIIRQVRKHNLPLWGRRITKQATQNWCKRIGFRLATSLITQIRYQ